MHCCPVPPHLTFYVVAEGRPGPNFVRLESGDDHLSKIAVLLGIWLETSVRDTVARTDDNCYPTHHEKNKGVPCCCWKDRDTLARPYALSDHQLSVLVLPCGVRKVGAKTSGARGFVPVRVLLCVSAATAIRVVANLVGRNPELEQEGVFGAVKCLAEEFPHLSIHHFVLENSIKKSCRVRGGRGARGARC